MGIVLSILNKETLLINPLGSNEILEITADEFVIEDISKELLNQETVIIAFDENNRLIDMEEL